jgi:hypothetical protein
MLENSGTQPPVWFRVIAVAAVVWALIGIAAYLLDVTMGAEALAQMPVEQQEIYAARPSWVVGLYAIAVFTALAGAVLLLLQRSVAVPLFAVSLVAVVIQMAYVLFGMNAVATLGASAAAFPAVIVAIGAFLFWFSIGVRRKGWLR